jgi:hypothetical protein
MRLKGGGIHLGYHTHYVVDGGKHRIILSVLVILGEVMDNQPMLDLLWRVLFRWYEARREQQMVLLVPFVDRRSRSSPAFRNTLKKSREPGYD